MSGVAFPRVSFLEYGDPLLPDIFEETLCDKQVGALPLLGCPSEDLFARRPAESAFVSASLVMPIERVASKKRKNRYEVMQPHFLPRAPGIKTKLKIDPKECSAPDEELVSEDQFRQLLYKKGTCEKLVGRVGVLVKAYFDLHVDSKKELLAYLRGSLELGEGPPFLIEFLSLCKKIGSTKKLVYLSSCNYVFGEKIVKSVLDRFVCNIKRVGKSQKS